MDKQIKVDVLYDSLATETQHFTDIKRALLYAYERNERHEVLEVQIDGERL